MFLSLGRKRYRVRFILPDAPGDPRVQGGEGVGTLVRYYQATTAAAAREQAAQDLNLDRTDKYRRLLVEEA